MIRDKRKTVEYFSSYITVQEKTIDEFFNLKHQLKDKAKIKQCNQMIANYQKNLFCAKYSFNATREELSKVFIEYLETLKCTDELSYSDSIDVLAIGKLLDVDCSDIVENDDDDLIRFLLDLDDFTGNLQYPTLYEPFYKYLMNLISEDEFISFVETEWYSNCRDLYWYDTHKSNNDTYVGYWCWLAAACLKIRNADVNKEFVYIPSI